MVPSSIGVISLDISMSHLSSFMFPGEGIQLPVSGQFSTPRSTSYSKKKKKNKNTPIIARY